MQAQPRNKRVILIAAVAMIVGAVSIGTAVAHKVRYTASVNLQVKDIAATPPATEPTTTEYSGKVNSTFARCERFRPVTITSSTGLFVQTITNINGDYAITGPKQAQGVTVTATINRKVLRKNRRHKHVCLAAATTHKAPK